MLRRWEGDTFPELYLCFIGRSPSTADAEHDDQTTKWMWKFTTEWVKKFPIEKRQRGFSLCNICDIAKINDCHVTGHAGLHASGIPASSGVNLPVIIQECRNAEQVVVCFGKVEDESELIDNAINTIGALQKAGKALWCLGLNGDGSPKLSRTSRDVEKLTTFDAEQFLKEAKKRYRAKPK